MSADARGRPAGAPARRVLLVLAIYGVALAARALLLPQSAGVQYLTFYPATVLAFYLCGTGPGWLLVALAAATGYVVFTPPYWHLAFERSAAIAMAVFVASAWLIGLVVARLQHATRREHDARQQLSLALASQRAVEQRLHTILEEQTDIVNRSLADGTVLYANAAWCRTFGVEREDIVGKRWHPMAYAEDLPMIERSLATLSPQHTAVTVENRVVTADGSLGWYQFVNRGSFDADGRLLEIQTVGRDISEMLSVKRELADLVERQAQQLAAATDGLRASEAQLRGIFETATDAIVTIDDSQTIVMANPAAERMFRCDRRALIGMPLEQLIPDHARAGHHKHVEDFAATGVSARHMGQGAVLHGRRADGEVFPVEAAISRASIEGRRLFTAIVRDITERLRADEALLASKAKLDTALASMTDAVSISDAEGRFVEFNDAFATFHRFASKSQCKATLAEYPDVLDVFMDDGSPAPLEQWAVPRALRGERASNVEYTLRRKDSGETWAGSYSFAPIRSPDGAIVGAVVTARDISPLKQTEAELKASHAELQRLIAAQNEVAEGERRRIARELHDDLLQKLAAIRIDLATLGSDKGSVAPQAATLLQGLQDLAVEAVASTRQILNDLRPPMLEDLGLLAAIDALTRQFGKRTGIACELEADNAAGDLLLGSPAVAMCLYRVTQEALHNVARHAGATEVQVRLAVAGPGRVALSVADDGQGLAPGARNKPRSFGLLGMRERVRAVGGELVVTSRTGAGTTIDVTVPLHDLAAGAPAPAATGSGPADGAHPAAARPLAAPDRGPGSGIGPVPAAGAGADADADERLQAIIDALPGNIAVLDRNGIVKRVNRAWCDFALLNGDPELRGTGTGIDYLQVCQRSAATGDKLAARVLQGLRAVLDGRHRSFTCTYPCHSPTEHRWFHLHATPVDGGGECMVTHLNVTRWFDPQPAAAAAADDAT